MEKIKLHLEDINNGVLCELSASCIRRRLHKYLVKGKSSESSECFSSIRES